MWYDITYIDEDDYYKPERHIRTQDRQEFIATLKDFKNKGIKVTDLTGENKNAINHTIKPPISMKLYKARENIPNNKREVEKWVTIGRKKNTNI